MKGGEFGKGDGAVGCSSVYMNEGMEVRFGCRLLLVSFFVVT